MTPSARPLLIISVFTALAVGLALAGEAVPAALRLMFGLPLALVLPGYTLTLALFNRAFVASARLMLSLGLSFIVTVLGAFVLNFTPAGLRAESWAVLLGSITLVGCLLAYIRQTNPNPSPNEHGTEVEEIVTAPLRRLSLSQMALFGVAGVAVAVAIVVASIGAQYPQTELVNMWIKRDEAANDLGRVSIGVDNVNSLTMSYRVRVQRGAFVVREWPALDVATGTTWVGTVELTANPPGTGPLEALLYRADNPQQVFRRVTLSLAQ
jgi:uncharacterized membrane protein